MPSQADVAELAQSNRDLRRLVLRDLAGLWAALDTTAAEATRDALLEVVPLLVAEYGEMAAAVAADAYDRLREQAGARGAYTATLADPVDPAVIEERIRWSVGPLFADEPDPAAALGRLSTHVDELTLQPGRDTIAASASRDPAKPRWARVPQGDTCAWCIALASRGGVYQSEQSARYKSSGGKYHGHCDCTPVPIYRDDPYPEGYDPDALHEQYHAARKAAGSGRLKPILSELREQQGLTH